MDKTREDIISNVAQQFKGIKKSTVADIVKATFETIIDEVADDNKVSIFDFGTFDILVRKEREGVNPQTHKKITIPETNVPRFKPGKKFKEAVQ